MRSINSCIGCDRPVRGVADSSVTSKDRNSASFQSPDCSNSGVISEICFRSSSPSFDIAFPVSVSFHVRLRCSMTSINSFRPLKCDRRRSERSSSSAGSDARNMFRACNSDFSKDGSSHTKLPESSWTPSFLRSPIPGPAS